MTDSATPMRTDAMARLLVVGPRPELAARIAEAAVGRNLAVVAADTLAAALARWAEPDVRAALVDLGGEGVDRSAGYRTLGRLREADPAERRTIVALVPGGAAPGRAVLDAINAAADDFLWDDPLDTEELFLRLALGQRRAGRIAGELAVRGYASAATDQVLAALPLVALQFQTDDIGRYRARFEPADFARIGLEIAVPTGIPGRDLVRHIAPVDRVRVAATCARAIRERAPFSEAFAMIDARGASRPVRVFAAPSARDAAGVQTWHGLVLDVSQQRELEHRVECATAGMRSKRAFLATASHELRTPLTAIIGMAQVLLRELPAEERGLRREALAVIEDSGGQLLRLVEDVLELAHLGGGDVALEAQPLDLSALARAEVERALPRAAEAGVRLVPIFDGPAPVVGDAARLSRAIHGLLDNAIKFTPAGGRVEVALVRDGDRDSTALEISDTGVGISPDQARALLQPLTQLDSGFDRRFGGMGLGLALAARIAALSGGSLELESGRGPGTRARLRLSSAPASTTTAPIGTGHIACVMDVPGPLAAAAASLGATLHVYPDSGALVAGLRDQPADLVLVGSPLGGTPATDLVAQLATDGATLVAVAGALLLPGDRARLREAGAAAVLACPVSPLALSRMLQLARAIPRHA